MPIIDKEKWRPSFLAIPACLSIPLEVAFLDVS